MALLPASEFLMPAGGVGELRLRLKGRGTLTERLRADLERIDTAPSGVRGAPDASGRPGPAAAGPTLPSTRAINVGDAAEVWAGILAPATGIDHLGAGTLLVLDEPGDIAEAADFLWRQADERRAELIAAGELPKAWPSTYLEPTRLEGSPGQRPDPRADLGVGGGRGHGVGRAEHGRRVRLARAVAAARSGPPDRRHGRPLDG